MLKPHFEIFARYNQWANRRLYAAAAELSDADRRADRGAFFHSMHGTLNHILVGDTIWLARFKGESGKPGLPSGLDQILHEDFTALRAAREAHDHEIIRFIDGLDEARISAPVIYKNTRGEVDERPLAPLLFHYFNHQTHHRGQAHTLLSQLGQDPPPLDLIYYLRER
jgi:uncharacterized damage-inducible protein DinB